MTEVTFLAVASRYREQLALRRPLQLAQQASLLKMQASTQPSQIAI